MFTPPSTEQLSQREVLLFGLFSFTGLGEGSSISLLAVGQGWGFSGCLKHQLLSASSDLLETKFSAAPSSPDDVVLSKPPLFASGAALEKAEPVSLASLSCRWSWWISGPGFFLLQGVFAARRQEGDSSVTPPPGSGCLAVFIQLEPGRVGRGSEKALDGPQAWACLLEE